MAWHLGFVGAVGLYALLKRRDQPSDAPVRSPTAAIAWSVTGVVAAVGGLTWGIVTWGDSLPPLVVSATAFSATTNVVLLASLLLYLLALAVLWARRSSVLDWWLMVAVLASVAEAALIAFIAASRYTLAFYSSRVFAMIVSSAVLVALVWEITKLYARLSRAVRSLQRERLAKLMNLEVMLSAVAHEIKQPLTAIVLNASATEHLLKRPVPDVARLRENVEDIRRDSLRVSEAFESVRGLLKGGGQERRPLDVNALLLASLELLSAELSDHEIRVTTELAPDLPAVPGHPGQLQEVFVNIVRNAIESMSAVDDRVRTLRLSTQHRDDGIAITIEDSGIGIEPKRLADLFDAFVTTKPDGMGLGLGICRMIVDRHGGLLSATSELGRSARFEIVLPSAPGTHPALANSVRGPVKAEA
jgi:signal transduction histidine kinase